MTGEAQLRDLHAADATEGRIRLDETGDGAPVGARDRVEIASRVWCSGLLDP